MIEIEEVLELFIAADEETKVLVEQLLRYSQQTLGEQGQSSQKVRQTHDFGP